jgi:hypothetical protein
MVRATCSASSTTWTTPTGVADLREALGTVDLARAATPARYWGRTAMTLRLSNPHDEVDHMFKRHPKLLEFRTGI